MKVLVSFLVSCTVALLLCAQPAFSQGSLTPPGPPAPMMRTLEQVEPRIPITNLPWTISSPGSYYLVTNLVGDAVAPDGIIVQVSDVTIDLRGFVLQGGTAGGSGIAVYNSVTGLKVYNGIIRDWVGGGIFAMSADNGELKELRVSNTGGNVIGYAWTVADCVFANNNGPGLYTVGRSTLKSCTSTGNAWAGLAVATNSVVIGCTASGNFMGIVTFQAGRVVDCTAEGNTMDGFFTGPSTSLSGCIARENLQHGFEAMENSRLANCVAEKNQMNGFFVVWIGGPPLRSGCKISGCTATENLQDGFFVADASTIENCVATANQNNGINVQSFCYVLGNTCDQNGAVPIGSGIKASGNQNRIDGNSVTRNAFAGIDCSMSFGNLIVRNSASQNLGADYAIAPGNNDAAIAVFPGAGFAVPPWNNFRY